MDQQKRTILSGVMFGYLILLLHVLLMIGLGILVIVIKGIYDFRWVILVLGMLLIGASGYYCYRYFRDHKRRLQDLMNDPALQDRTLEISLLGGMAAVRLGHRDERVRLVEPDADSTVKQLEAPRAGAAAELAELNRMLEDGLITRDEFLELKKEILRTK